MVACPEECECPDELSLHCHNVSTFDWNILSTARFESLQSLSITHSSMDDVSALPGLQLLEKLDLTGNKLKTLNVVAPL
ncbi:unnamed protein product, partial [Mesorhabditis belari]|uniref:LRRNT domain-containing protein n=1 Tax=Mesorhabditis belari TaxID=2138241 RepID=A0AAF3JBF6_9BILA